MLSENWRKNLKLLSFIVKCIVPEFSDLAILYLLCSYFRLKRRKEGFAVKVLHPKLFHQIIRKHDKSKLFDINNTIIINKSLLFEDEIFVKLAVNENSISFEKIVLAAGLPSCPSSHIFMSNILIHNVDKNIALKNVTVKPVRTSKLEFASEIEISFFPHPSVDLHFLAVHAILKNFFNVPKLIYKDEIMEINLKTYAKDIYYAMSDTDKMNDFNQTLYIKCNKIIKNGNQVSGGCLCVYKETSVTQAADSTGFLPTTSKCCLSIHDEVDNSLRAMSPLGLHNYFEEFQKAVQPFLMKKIPLNPVFLIEGSKGDGKEHLLQELASHFGINHYRINSIDLTANVYAQNETKLRNVFFTAKTSAPCLLSVHYFENFGKNNEGEYDERLIGHFKSELDLLLQNNTFPVIVFCCSNTKEIPAELRRLFLQIFHFEAPCEEERESIIKWFLDSNNMKYSFNIKDLASQTNGFLYEDLKAFIQNAYVNKMKKIQSCKEEIILGEEDIMKSLARLQSSYNESIGAPKVPKVQWSDIGGLGDIKEEIDKTINLPLKYPDLLKVTGLKRSGILLFGPPGTGKTLLAKAIATECGLCFLSIKGPELLNKYVGQSEQNVREVFQKARQASPCIIFFDELDSLAPNRGRSGDSGVMDRVVSQLLAEMDGLNEEKVVFVIGATNRPDLIDPALLRPGRFDKLLYVGPCTDELSKVSVLKAITQKFNLHNDVDFNKLIKISPNNITGADFYGVCSNAWTSAVRRLIKTIETDNLNPHNFSQKDVFVSMEDFEYAFKNTKPSISEVDLLYYEKLKEELSSKK